MSQNEKSSGEKDSRAAARNENKSAAQHGVALAKRRA
jgi:hypothetical protein